MTQLSEALRSSSSSSSGGDGPSEPEALQQLHEDLESLAADQPGGVRPSLDGLDLPSLGSAKGTGPRLFCGHVPKEVNDEMVRQHFSKWGTVNDVYFPRHKKTLKRRPFCFVTFANKEDAERALAESGLEIAGVPIKNLTMVEDRDKYYTNKHASARQALLQALKQLGPGSGGKGGAAGGMPPLPPAHALAQQQNLSSVMHSSFYQPAAPQAPPPAPQPEVQHSMSTVMSSGFYGGAPATHAMQPPPMPLRHSMADFRGVGAAPQPHASTSGLPFADATWAAPLAHQQPAHQQQHGHGMLAGYSTALRPSIDRAGLPPLPPRSPSQDPAAMRPAPGSGSPDSLLTSNGWPLAGQRLTA